MTLDYTGFLTSAAAPNLARIPAGDFLMGAADGGVDERPVHRVHLDEFFIGRFPVTNDEYAKFVHATRHSAPSVGNLPLIASEGRDHVFRELAEPYVWHNAEPPRGHGSHPVVLVRLHDAVAYCAWLAESWQRPVRLPTEAEWEKAARGGTEGTKYPWGDACDPSHCHYLTEAADKNRRGTRPTGTYPPNGYGLFDMIGNVWEWVSDWYEAGYYATDTVNNPRGPESGSLRIVRGGSWVSDDLDMLRCAYRHKVPPDTYAYSVGFRVVCST
jgi:formylglycine-generating enzyme required for sulfatase activity